MINYSNYSYIVSHQGPAKIQTRLINGLNREDGSVNAANVPTKKQIANFKAREKMYKLPSSNAIANMISVHGKDGTN